MNFSEWHETLSEDKKIVLCKHDVWKGALNTAIDDLRTEYAILMNSKLPTVGAGVSIAIEILKNLLEDKS